MRVRAVAQKEPEGRGVPLPQRELGWSAALLVHEVNLGTCVEENVDAFDVSLLSSGVEGCVSVDSLHVETSSVLDEEARHRSMPFPARHRTALWCHSCSRRSGWR